MEAVAAIFAAWSMAIYAVIRAVGETPAGKTTWWARLLPVMPLVIGGLSGPTVIPIAAQHLPLLADVGTAGAVMLGIGAGAVAASGHSTHRQTVQGKDCRIRRQGEGVGGKADIDMEQR